MILRTRTTSEELVGDLPDLHVPDKEQHCQEHEGPEDKTASSRGQNDANAHGVPLPNNV